jgi:nucleotide-binding universal stress UspA family protein
VYKNMLVPLDGSDIAATVLEQVVTLAQACGACVHLLTVGLSLPGASGQAEPIQLTQTFQAEAYLHKVRLYLEQQGLQVTSTVCIGEPAHEILHLAEQRGMDLIIINSRGGGGTAFPFWGSIAEKVAGGAHVPVLIFHPPAGTEAAP